MHERHIPIPSYQPYFEHKFTAIIGGNCTNSAAIMDKILLANSLMDHASQMFFVGEFGMAAVHALGPFPGKHDRFEKETH